jgi:hypothetical protein
MASDKPTIDVGQCFDLSDKFMFVFCYLKGHEIVMPEMTAKA